MLAAVYGIAVPDSPRCYLPAAFASSAKPPVPCDGVKYWASESSWTLPSHSFVDASKCREVARADEPETVSVKICTPDRGSSPQTKRRCQQAPSRCARRIGTPRYFLSER